MKFFIKNIVVKYFIIATLSFSFSSYSCAEESSFLTNEESGVLLQYFADTYVKKPAELYFKYNGKLESVYTKILGNYNVKKNENEIRWLITLVYITYTYKHSSNENIILDNLYERFMLQPREYFSLLLYFKDKRNAFCYYLGQSYGVYLYNNKISSDKYNRRELFKKQYLSSMQILENTEDVDSCLNKIPIEMPVYD